MKSLAVAVVLLLSSVGAYAQGIAPLMGSNSLVIERSLKVSLEAGDKRAWTDYTPRAFKWSRTADGLEVFSGETSSVLIDTKTFLHYPVAVGVSQLSETISQNSTREGQSLEPGGSWKADRTYASPPASWCSNSQNKLDSKFEVEPREQYTLTIDGKETAIEVTPVVERGWWTRCYAGRRYTRFLVSKDLGAVVSIEHVGYTPQEQAHSSSFRLNVKEIKRQ